MIFVWLKVAVIVCVCARTHVCACMPTFVCVCVCILCKHHVKQFYKVLKEYPESCKYTMV